MRGEEQETSLDAHKDEKHNILLTEEASIGARDEKQDTSMCKHVRNVTLGCVRDLRFGTILCVNKSGCTLCFLLFD